VEAASLGGPAAETRTDSPGQEDFHLCNTIRALVKIRRSNFQQYSTTGKNKNSYYYQLFANKTLISRLS